MTSEKIAKQKISILQGLRQVAGAGPGQVAGELEKVYAKNATWRGSHPIHELKGCDEIAGKFWRPLQEAMPDLERRDFMFVGGEYEGATYLATVGHLLGNFDNPWLGFLPTHKPVHIRYGESHRLDGDRIAESIVIFDLLDFIHQLGLWPLAPMLGSAQMWPCPQTADGMRLSHADADKSAASLQLVRAMLQSLQDYDDSQGRGPEGLLEMPQKEYWHDKMMWYGPAGIGTSRGLAGFVNVHQHPFRVAFPNRDASAPYMGIGDDHYVAVGGWDCLKAKHLGGGWLGLPPSGREVVMRILDFYRCEDGRIRENWVALDMLDALRQLGLDVLARMRENRVGMTDR